MAEQKLSITLVRAWLQMVEAGKEFHYTKALDGAVDPASYPHLRKIMFDLCASREIKASGYKDGYYKKIAIVNPVNWWDADETVYFDLRHPVGRPNNCVEESEFGWEDLINISPGDVLVITGVSNYGKSVLVLNYLAANLDLHECVLMGNEYTAMDGTPSPKFKRRLGNMNWVTWFKEDGTPKFELLPVRSDFESYVKKGKLNLIDWINLPENPFMIGMVIENIKVAIGDGVAIIVVQKNRTNELGVGGQFTEHLADAYFSIDPHGQFESRVTVGKVKDAKSRVTGRAWAFSIVDGGANLSNIREVVKCHVCWGKGFKKAGQGLAPCDSCNQVGWVNK